MLDVFQNVLERLKGECLAKGYEMLLEADVSGWLFHLLLTQPEVKLQQIHLGARVCNAGRRFFDIVVGSLQTGAKVRPCTHPRLVVEVKNFPRIGFTNSQHRVRYEEILNEDLPKLDELDSTIESRVSFIVDGKGYLEKTCKKNNKKHNRREYLISKRNEVASGVHIFIMRLADDTWQIEHEAPETMPNTL